MFEFAKKSFDFVKQPLFKTAKAPDLNKYVGKKVSLNGETIVIETIVGNKFKPAFYEINGKHLMGMLRFHAQMLGDNSITEEQFLAFEGMEMHAERIENEPTSKEIDITNIIREDGTTEDHLPGTVGQVL